ncbi:MAG: aldehyde dehydrogenase family protein [Pseudomonadota bacterium]
MDEILRMRQVFVQLQQTSVRQRLNELGKVRAEMLRQRETVVESLMRECGKTRIDANIEFLGTVDWLKWLEDHGERFLREEHVPTPITLMGKKSRIFYEGLGPVLIIAPWNYPLHIGITQIFTAFACGNTVVYKPSEVTPMRGIYESLLAASSLLSRSVTVVYGDGDKGRELIDQRPEKIFFTGSTKTGRAIARQAADYLIPVDLELGGKDPMIVFAGANLDRAVAAAVWGAFTHNGQSCSAVERLYVQDSIYEEFIQRLKAATEALVQKPGDDGDADLGRLTVDFQYRIARKHIDEALEKGARVLAGGGEIDADKLLMEPTVLVDVDDGMLAVSEETFGPVLPVLRFADEEEVVRKANDSRYGLQASVFTPDKAQAERVAHRLEVGGVSINNVNMVEGNPWLSFGGRKETGWGRARGVEGLRAFTRSKHILADPDNGKIEANWYPYTRKKHDQVVRFIHALFERSPLRLLRVIATGLKLERISQKKRD